MDILQNKKVVPISIMVVAVTIIVTGFCVMLSNSLNNSNSTPTNSSTSRTTVQATYIHLPDSVIGNLVNGSSEDILVTNSVLGDQNSLIFSHFPEKRDLQTITAPELQNGSEQIRNGYFLTYKDETAQFVIQLIRLSDGVKYDFASLPKTEEIELIISLSFSKDGKKIYITQSGDNSKNTLNALEIKTHTRIYCINLNQKSMTTMLDQIENLQASDVVASYGETTILRHYATETSASSLYLFNLSTGKKIKDLDELRDTFQWHVSPSGKQILFVVSNDMEGKLMPFKLLVFDLTTQSFIDLKNLDQSSLQASDFGAWPDRTEFNSIAWAKDGKSLLLLKRVFSNSDIENAQIFLLRYELSSGQVTTISTFSSKTFSASNILGDINGVTYVPGSINGTPQINAFPENKKVTQLNQGDSVNLIY